MQRRESSSSSSRRHRRLLLYVGLRVHSVSVCHHGACKRKMLIFTPILPPIRGSLPEVIRSCCHHHPPQGLRRPFERARHAHAPPTARRRRVAGAPAARDLGAAATPLARRPLAMSHRTGAPLECGGGGGSKVLAVCHPTLALRRSSKHALHRASRAAGSTRRLRHPHPPPGDNVRSYAGGTCRRPGAQRPRLRRRARSARQ